MTLLSDFTDILESTSVTNARKDGHKRAANSHQRTPVGGPSESHAREVLTTLRSRLDEQIQASDEYESAETRAIMADARYRLAQVNDALARMEEGRYGQCVDCTTLISPDRLVIQPFATRCIGCQERHDRKVRRAPSQG